MPLTQTDAREVAKIKTELQRFVEFKGGKIQLTDSLDSVAERLYLRGVRST